MSAAGCTVVDLYRYNNLMDHTDITSRLAHQSPLSLARGILTVLESREGDLSAAKNVSSSLSGNTIQWESDSLVARLTSLVDGSLNTVEHIGPKYLSQPLIAVAETNAAAREFCLRQMNEATKLPNL
jgi:hypothetical protein